MARKEVSPPAFYLVEGAVYPEGPFRSDITPEAAAAAGVLNNLIAWNENFGFHTSHATLSARLMISPSMFNRYIRGVSYPDFATVAKLEEVTGVILWPSLEHRYRLTSGKPARADDWLYADKAQAH